MKTQDTKYNGWKNYETWNIKLWLDNDEFIHGYWRDVAHGLKDLVNAERQLAEQLKEEHESALPDELTGWQADLLRGALGSVDWYEIAESLLEVSSSEGN